MSDDLQAEVESLRAENADLRAKLGAAAPYVPVAYPAFRYHADGRSCVVADAEADEALGEGWSDKPSDLATTVYPAWRYHATASPRQVLNAAEDAALPPGYYASVAAAAAG